MYSVKRLMGRKFEDPEVQRDLKPDGLQDPARRRNGDAEVSMGGRGYSPAEVSAMILQKLKADAEAYLGDERDGGGDHRPGVLQRLAAAGDEGRGQDRGPRSAAHHQRADGGGAGVRARQEARRDDRGLRPGRRHVRHLDPGAGRRHVPGEVDERRHAPGRRRLRPADHRLPGRRVQARAGHRPEAGPDGAAAAEGSGGEGEDRAFERAADGGQPAVHHGGRIRPEAHDDQHHAREARAAGGRPGGARRWSR